MGEFQAVPRIETRRLLLACWAPGDAVLLTEALHESREHLLPWMPWAKAEPEPVTAKLQLLMDWKGAFVEARDFHYAVFERRSGRLLGALGAHPRIGPQALELGYWIRAGEVGRGVATEAAAVTTRVALELMGAHRAEIRLDARNVASERVPQKLGYRLEGRLREDLPDSEGSRGDRLIYGMLASEVASSPVMDTPLRALGWDGEVLLDDGLGGPA